MRNRPTLRLVLASLASTLAFLALTILAWGDFRGFFANPARIGFLAVTALAAIATLFSGVSMGGGRREDRSNRWIFLPIIGITAGIGFLAPYMDGRNIWTLDGDGVRYLGLMLFAAGAFLRVWTVFALGWRFSPLVAIQEGHTLVMEGVYRTIRHPSYLGALIAMVGWALVFRSGVGALLAVALLPAIIARINAEEALLESEFGAEYRAYRERTWRLIPHIY